MTTGEPAFGIPARPGTGGGLRRFILRHLLIGLALSAALPAQTGGPSSVPVKAATDGTVWGGLVYAFDGEPAPGTAPATEVQRELFSRLGKVFPFRHFTVLGEHSQVVFREYESWVVPSKDLFLKLDSKGAAKDGGINLHLQFWQGQQVLVKTDAVLRPSSPLFIAGPKWREGRLIFVLELRKVEAGPRS